MTFELSFEGHLGIPSLLTLELFIDFSCMMTPFIRQALLGAGTDKAGQGTWSLFLSHVLVLPLAKFL